MISNQISNNIIIEHKHPKHAGCFLENIDVLLSKKQFSFKKEDIIPVFNFLNKYGYTTSFSNQKIKWISNRLFIDSVFQNIKQLTHENSTRLFINDVEINKIGALTRDAFSLFQSFSKNIASLDLDNKILRSFPDIKSLKDFKKKLNLIFIRLMNLVELRNLIVLIIFVLFNLKIGVLLHIVNELTIEFYKNLINILWYSKTNNDHYRKVN